MEGNHGDCYRVLKEILDLFGKSDDEIVKKFQFVAAIFDYLRQRLKQLFRRHNHSHYSRVVTTIKGNPPMSSILMNILDPNQLDDTLYLRVLQSLVNTIRDVKTLETCLGLMKISDRGSREGITESYRMSLVRFVLENAGEEKNAVFDVSYLKLFILNPL